MSDLKYVGKNIFREDSYGRATGETKYICDMKRSNMLYAKILQSEKPHANVTIDKSEALKVKGIVEIFTFEDVPKVQYNSHKWSEVVEVCEDEYIISDKARFVGDKIAVVVGESIEAVKEGLYKVKVIYDELPPVLSISEENLAFTKDIFCGDYKTQFEKADFIIEDKGKTPRIHHAAIEPHICLSEIDDNGNLVIYSPCQVVTLVQSIVSKLLNLPYGKIRVIKAAMGGSFGGKGQAVLEPICAFITYKLKKPVKLIMDRKETILGTRTRNAAEIKVRTAVTKDGKIVGREIIADIDSGAYYTNASAIVMSMGKKASRLYDIKDQLFRGNSYYTNKLVGGAARGYGSPQLHAITEINIDNAAKKLNMDPCEFRLTNLVNPFDNDPTGGPNLGNAQVKECLIRGMEIFDWKNRRDTVKNKDTERFAYGVGVACGAHGNGYKGAYPDFTNVNIMIHPDGNVVINIGIHELGCGTVATLKQIAAETLQIPIEKIIMTEADTLITPYDSAGTQASRVTFVCGGAVKKACEKIKEKIIDNCNKLMKVDKEKIKVKDGYVYIDSIGKKLSFGVVALITEKELYESLSKNIRYESPSNPGSYAVSFAEVKVDKFTGQVEVVEMVALQDVGKSINPILVEGQILGGANFSIGMALQEEILIDEKGYVKTKNFSKYHLINAPSMPNIKVITIEKNEPDGPYGAKSVGEMSAVAPGPAVINAINHALDTNITEYPATPEVIIANICLMR